MSKIKQPVIIFWFRRDLRLEDNHGLKAALDGGLPVLPIFIFDREILDHLPYRADRRVMFIHSALSEMDHQLRQLGSGLTVLHDTPHAAFNTLLQRHEVKAVYTNHDDEPYAIRRDREIGQLMESRGVTFHHFKDQVIFERGEVLKSDGTPYTVFTPYSRAWKNKMREVGMTSHKIRKENAPFLQYKPDRIPDLAQIGFEKTDPGPTAYQLDKKILEHYEQTRNYPALDSTTHISTALRFGTVSVRALAAKAMQHSETWLNELIWREFFMMILYHFPRVVNSSFKERYDQIAWINNKGDFERWCNGETGIPLVDAGMRELNQTGFMHNRVRMITASFLTKHLLIDWRWGEAYFAGRLNDYELSSNNGNWQWAAGCGCDAAPYFRIFNPIEQARKFDPKSEYIRRWIEPAGYEKISPVVDLAFGRQRALETYKKALGKEV